MDTKTKRKKSGSQIAQAERASLKQAQMLASAHGFTKFCIDPVKQVNMDVDVFEPGADGRIHVTMYLHVETADGKSQGEAEVSLSFHPDQYGYEFEEWNG